MPADYDWILSSLSPAPCRTELAPALPALRVSFQPEHMRLSCALLTFMIADNLLLTGLHDGPHFADDYALSMCETFSDSDGNLRLTSLSLGSQSLPQAVCPKAKRERYQGFEFLSRKCPRSSSPTLQWSPLASPTHFYACDTLHNGYDINYCENRKGFDIDLGRSRPLSSASSATTIVSAPHNASAFSPVTPRTETCQSQHLVANSGKGPQVGIHMQFRSVATCTRSCACFDVDYQCADPEFVRTALKELQMCAVDMFDEDLDGCPGHVWTQFGHYFNA